jgi:tetratricopeptide (TPR) repeat protein
MSTAALLLLALLAQAPAKASPPLPDRSIAKADAQALLREGTMLYGRGDYAAALEKFKAAYSVYPRPKLLFNIGEANRRLAHPVEALDAFERFLADAKDASAQSRGEAQESVAELKARLARISINTAAAGAEVAVDGTRAGTTPLPRSIWVAPGRHQVTVTRADTLPFLKEVTVAAGDARALAVDLLPIDGSAPPAAIATTGAPSESAKPITKRWAFWAVVGAAAVLGTVAIIASSSSSSSPAHQTVVPDTTLGAQPF